ncbi:hypothetical protein J3R83DRAFT_6031 [Lanmaoa asiatica]|nr:hypothetical protein J3R83DRAFT_6031 [Lanmaoa asiatica]
MRSITLSALLGLHQLVAAQDGVISGPTTSASATGYSCYLTKCQLPKCNSASTSPPDAVSPSEVPQFVLFTADDAVQILHPGCGQLFLAHRKDPNGCLIKMTYYTSLTYTNYTLVTDWYIAGNEIANHTSDDPRWCPTSGQDNGNLIALNALSGIPLDAIKGFRAPYLNYTDETFHLLAVVDFMYGSSTAASIPVTDPDTDAYWPYALDYGLANDCLTVEGICQGQPQIPGLWEIPMYAFFDELGVDGPHLMDPRGSRQPIRLYSHRIHLSTTYPGVDPANSTIDMINRCLDWVQEQQNVWLVSNEQLLAWVQDPVPVSQLDTFIPLKRPTLDIDPTIRICNGIPANEQGLLDECAFSDFPLHTCYGCPQVEPSMANPNPP